MEKLLLVEDDEALAMGIRFALMEEGSVLDHAPTLAAAWQKLNAQSYDMVLLDVMMPDGSGFDFLKRLRRQSEVPVIFLTACDEEVHIVQGLDTGGDDYLTKPFRLRELTSRIRAVLRRKRSQSTDGSVLVFGPLHIHTVRHQVFLEDVEVPLTQTEYKLLFMLVQHRGQPLSRSQIVSRLWDIDGEFVDDNTLSVYIRRLREKLKEDPTRPVFIATVRGYGYKWIAESEED